MANTKNYSLREKIIDKYLCRGWYTRQQLEDACNDELEAHREAPITSRQTIINDLDTIASRHHVTIEKKKCGRTTYYRYQDSSFSIYKPQLSPDDYHRLREALKVIKSFTGMPQFEWADGIGHRLDMRLNRDGDIRTIVSFEDSAYNTGIQHFTPIFNAISEKTTLNVSYKSFKSDDVWTFDFSPYYLKEYNNRWFVLGKSPGYERISIYALDRILSLGNAGVKYEDTDVDFDTYFENVVGVTVRDEEVQTVEVWFSKQQLDYIETKPLHRSQRLISRDETGGILQFDLIPNYELEQAILAQGEYAKVLAPASLRAKIRQRLCDSLTNYGYVQIPWMDSY